MRGALPSSSPENDPRRSLGDDDMAAAQAMRFPVVAGQRRRSDGLGLAAGVLGALALGAITFASMTASRQGKPQEVASAVAPQPAAHPQITDQQALLPTNNTSPPAASTPAPAAPVITQAPPARIIYQTVTPPARANAPALVQDSYASELPIGAPSLASASEPASGSASVSSLSADEIFTARIHGAGADRATATPLASPEATVVQGTLIAAILETGVNSDLPGYVRAVVSQDVRSFDNSHTLIPRGSRLVGQYKSGVSAGQTRVYIVWSRLIRPDGASVALASPGTDLGGQTGVPGKVDGHFLKRFGAAMLLSVIGGVASAGNSVVISTSGSAASVAAQSSANIPPTIKVPQGQPIRIFTARDLDFSAVGSSDGR